MIIEEMNDERNGFCRYWDHSIHIRKGMPQLQTIKTLLHETAHSLLHDPYQESESEFQDYVLEHARLRGLKLKVWLMWFVPIFIWTVMNIHFPILPAGSSRKSF